MSDFAGTFFAVFLAVTLGEIAKEAYQRWIQNHVKKGFDTIDKTKERITNGGRL